MFCRLHEESKQNDGAEVDIDTGDDDVEVSIALIIDKGKYQFHVRVCLTQLLFYIYYFDLLR